jgi:hypothetical protein
MKRSARFVDISVVSNTSQFMNGMYLSSVSQESKYITKTIQSTETTPPIPHQS